MVNNRTITKEDLEKYKEQIEYWKNIKREIEKHKDTLSQEVIQSLKLADARFFRENVSEEEICSTVKEVYEFSPTVEDGDYIKYASWISDLRKRYPNDFKTDEDVILFKKNSENDERKTLFEPLPSPIKRMNEEELEVYLKEMEAKGCMICE